MYICLEKYKLVLKCKMSESYTYASVAHTHQGHLFRFLIIEDTFSCLCIVTRCFHSNTTDVSLQSPRKGININARTFLINQLTYLGFKVA